MIFWTARIVRARQHERAGRSRSGRLDDPLIPEDLQALAQRALVARALLRHRLIAPFEEAALGLEADAALVDVLLQHRGWALGVAEVGPDDLGDGAGGVPAGVLLLHDRPGRGVAEAEAQPHRGVDVFRRGDALLDQPQRLAHQRTLDAVAQEADHVLLDLHR